MKNGSLWLDDMSNPVQAHGGCILKHNKMWYWYGENKDIDNFQGQSRVPFIGISCYSSADLIKWHFEGNVLEANRSNPDSPIHISRVCERPKIVFNEKTNKFVLWFHADNNEYSFAKAGVAVSNSPKGPFEFIATRHVNRTDCRDMTLFCDMDGTAYLIHSGDWNKTMYISQLDDDFTDATGFYTKAMIDQEREAPAMLYHNGLYFMITSGCTGWKPNNALYAVSPKLISGGKWKLIDNPCAGAGYRSTFGGQIAHVFKVENQHYLLLDHWKPENLRESGYSILPIQINGEYMEIPWLDEFNGIS